ncbi:MAG: hypothetical protein GY854_31020 [Deltaproteobacteria bacterium]|nr:hypothetical protein [Deltaproteobacteria bacterium]
MKPETIIETLVSWRDILRDIAEVEISIDLERAELDKRLSHRQQGIDQIQKLDASLREVAELRRNGWPKIEAETPKKAEILIQEGTSICRKVAKRDMQLVEIAKEKRGDILRQLKETSMGKGYLTSSHQAQIRPPVIVDSNA